ncbi:MULTISPECIES: DUF4328 domain-containing protein [unclassified Nocardioides]|uniref:DUF4328 domain-containing protein n=1 Tax=unclassified Nocardioides TaxID=2615069 RepID=UPI0006F6AA9B|nr:MULTISPECIES: DUF4328 domain-containing protein [unclassified Nocardioides]KRA38298.1 hypothetical protein ASD81_06560 [Nocardioides sp. Root614]KRA92257.1 hypothetical protein ASD84_06825 [Nocardioides sp. Root682]
MVHHVWGEVPPLGQATTPVSTRPAVQPPTTPERPVPASATRPKALQGLAHVIVALAVTVTVLEVFTALFSNVEPGTREAFLLGGDLVEDLAWYEEVQLLTYPLLLVAYLPACLWLYRARANSFLIDPRAIHERARAWVWLGWILPLVHLWYPYQVVRDVQNGSVRRGTYVEVTVWWGAWLTWLFATRTVAGLLNTRDRDPMMAEALSDTAASVTALNWISAAAAVLACVQWCRIVLGVTASQRLAFSPPR